MTQRGKLSDKRYEDIKREIVFMFQETGTDAYPIDCFEIARRLHYVLRSYSALEPAVYREAVLESNEGFSRVEQDPDTGMNYYAIYYNDEDHTAGNIRWTIFHEIGHIYLGHHDEPPGNEQAEEDEANFFAKYAMCPPPLLGETQCKCPQDVREKFCTSGEFAEYAYKYFHNWAIHGPSTYLPYELELLKQFHFR